MYLFKESGANELIYFIGMDLDSMFKVNDLSTLIFPIFFVSLPGKAAVVSVLSLDTNLRSLLPFVESTGNTF